MTKKQRILELADGTRTCFEIAELANSTPGAVRTVLWREGVFGKLTCTIKPKIDRNRAIVSARNSGEKFKDIAARFGISKPRACAIYHREMERGSL